MAEYKAKIDAFFQKQLVDEAGFLIVKFQKILVAVGVILFISIVQDLITVKVLAEQLGDDAIFNFLWVLFAGGVAYSVLFVGFYGSYLRNRSFLNTWMTCRAIFICCISMFVVLFLFVLFVGRSPELAHAFTRPLFLANLVEDSAVFILNLWAFFICIQIKEALRNATIVPNYLRPMGNIPTNGTTTEVTYNLGTAETVTDVDVENDLRPLARERYAEPQSAPPQSAPIRPGLQLNPD